jgi:SAM-dependent methyltransferase
MNTDEYRRMYVVEDTHWWYHNLHQLVLNQLRSGLKRSGGRRLRILDAGCGTGAMAIKLAELGDVTAMDFSHDALQFCRERDLSDLVAGSVNELPFADASFDVVVSLDVLCHRSVDEKQAAGELARVLRPGGLLVLNLPAYDWLKGQHDVAVQTARRYTRRRVRALYEGAGLQVLQARHWNTILFPAAAAMRIASRRRLSEEGASDVQPVQPALNKTLKGVLGLERGLMKLAPLPFGLSVLAVGRRPEAAPS